MDFVLAIIFAVLLAVAVVDAITENVIPVSRVDRVTRGSWKWKAVAAAVAGLVLLATSLT